MSVETKRPPMAMCRCGEPLICTLAFSKFEFYCLCCGRKYGWLDPSPADPTPELDARYATLKAEWDEIAPALIGGVMLDTCDTCKATSAAHWNHATDEEKAAHESALAKLVERARQVPA